LILNNKILGSKRSTLAQQIRK